jgi:Rrf2 family iron-sulfur cluster assembly transcriptional regulator
VFRTETRHALRALSALAHQETSSLAVLSPAAGVPAPMLAKLLHRLSQADLVRGTPGPGGGYRLARPASEIPLREIVTLLEGPSFGASCLFGLPACSEENPCPLHLYWGEIRGRVFDLIDRHTVADLAAGVLSLSGALGSGGTGSSRRRRARTDGSRAGAARRKRAGRAHRGGGRSGSGRDGRNRKPATGRRE